MSYGKHTLGLRILVVAVCAVVLELSCSLAPYNYPDNVVLPAVQLSTTSVHVLAFGDYGTGSSSQKADAAGMASRELTIPFDFGILLGDNFYPDGVSSADDPQFESKYLDIYPQSSFPFKFYDVLGNHDYHQNPIAEYDYRDPSGRWTAPAPAYILPVYLSGGYHIDFYFVDSVAIDKQDDTAVGLVQWVHNHLVSRSADYVVISDHFPFYSTGRHGNTKSMLDYFGPDLAAGRINLTLSGHDHDLELQSRPEGSGTGLFVVSGAAATPRPIPGGPYTLFKSPSSSTLGFVELTLSASSKKIQFFDSSANSLYQYAY